MVCWLSTDGATPRQPDTRFRAMGGFASSKGGGRAGGVGRVRRSPQPGTTAQNHTRQGLVSRVHLACQQGFETK